MLNGIEQLCKFTFHFSNMDTFFINQSATIKLEHSLTTTPEPLKPYFSGMIEHLKLYDYDSEYDVFFHSNSFKLNFISARVTDSGKYIGSIVIGPYLLEEPSKFMIESIISYNKMAISLKNIMSQYYLTLPTISTNKAKNTAEFLSYMVSTFHSYTFGTNSKIGSLSYDFQTEHPVPFELIKENTEQAMEAIEKRYRMENEMLYAVESGNIELYDAILTENKSMLNISDRIPNDPMRSIKNTGFVLNTLLRKAAEKGGVHPIYLHSLSTKFAVQIEKCTSFQQTSELYRSMQLGYCDAVRKLSLKNYSSPIRKAIEYIRINLNQDLSLDTISGALNLNPYELSRQFKKETGKTLTEIINNRRINEAIYILENENISITDIALMVGFNDVNYFTKVFKKIKGITPSDYRKNKS